MKYRHRTATPVALPKTRSPHAAAQGKIAGCFVESCNCKIACASGASQLAVPGPAP